MTFSAFSQPDGRTSDKDFISAASGSGFLQRSTRSAE